MAAAARPIGWKKAREGDIQEYVGDIGTTTQWGMSECMHAVYGEIILSFPSPSRTTQRLVEFSRISGHFVQGQSLPRPIVKSMTEKESERCSFVLDGASIFWGRGQFDGHSVSSASTFLPLINSGALPFFVKWEPALAEVSHKECDAAVVGTREGGNS